MIRKYKSNAQDAEVHVDVSLVTAIYKHLHALRPDSPTNRGVKKSDFEVLWNTRMSACLVEMGFISHPVEEEFMKDYYIDYALAIYRRIMEVAK